MNDEISVKKGSSEDEYRSTSDSDTDSSDSDVEVEPAGNDDADVCIVEVLGGIKKTQKSNQPLVIPPTATGSSCNDSDKLCEICTSSPSKYRCPGCEMRTCSLLCVKEHKARLHCSGERNKTAFVDMAEYTDINLLNDYRFLEDAERKLYSNKMVPENRRRAVHGAPYYISKRSKLLMTAAYKRGVKLQMVSPALTRNKVNSSFYTISSDTIDWHIEWHFVATNTVVKDEKVPETTTLLDAAQKFTNAVQYPHLRKCLEEYKKEKFGDCQFLLKVEGLPANTVRYFDLKPQATIAENLKGHCLTEYPTIMILAPSTTDNAYQLLSKDDMPLMDPASARHLASFFPEFDLQAAIESKLLNPRSSVYTATSENVGTD